MDELISRRAVIDVIEDFPHGGVWNVESMEEMVYRIEQLPSAQPKMGKWIPADDLFQRLSFYCSECGEVTLDTVMFKPRARFCPMCGAKMEGVDDE